MQTDYAGQTVAVIDPATGVIFPAQIFVAVLGASHLTFAFASFSQKLPEWIDGQVRGSVFSFRPTAAAGGVASESQMRSTDHA